MVRVCCIGLCGLLAVGCAPFTRGIGAGTVQGGLEALSQEEQRRQVADIVSDPHIREAMSETAAEIADAIVARVASPERTEAIEGALDRFVESTAGELGRNAGRGVAAGVVAELRRTTLFEPGEVEAFFAEAGDGMAQGLAQGIRADLGPAVADSLRDDIALALEQALDARLNDALGRTGRIVGHEATLGIGAGLEELDRRPHTPFFDQISELLEQGGSVARWGIIAAVALMLISLLAVIVLFVAHRRARKEAARTRAALVMIIAALKRVEDRPWSPELAALLRDTFRDDENADIIRRILRSDPSLRLEPREVQRVKEAIEQEMEGDMSGVHRRAGAEPPATETARET